jgi:hypothetical protein
MWVLTIRYRDETMTINLKASPVRSPTASGALSSIMERFKITAPQVLSYKVDQWVSGGGDRDA